MPRSWRSCAWSAKPAKVKNKPGRRKQKVAVEDLDEDAAEPEEHAGEHRF